MTEPMVRGSITAADGMANVVAGLGAANAKTQNIYINYSDPVMLEASYRGSTWFGAIVDGPATDAVREWRQWQAKPDEITKLEATEKRLQVKVKVRDALILQRLLGGAVLIPTGLPGNSELPLDVNRIGVDSIKSLTLLNRYQVQTEGRVSDINSPWFGGPEFYIVSQEDGTQVKLHPSRVVRFSGRRFTHQNSGDDGWGDSIWLRMADSIQNSETGAAVLAQLLVEAKIDVIAMPDLTSNMSSEKHEQALMRRMTIATQLKSVANTLLLDKDDVFSQKSVSFTNVPETVLMLLQIMCGAARYPMTKLLGTQSKGLSNGGDADLKNYYDEISSGQELDLDPCMMEFNRMLVQCALGKADDSIWHEWRPLYQMSEKEEAEVEGVYATAVEKLVNTGLFPPEALSNAVADRMINSGSWPALDAALKATKQKAEEVMRGEREYEPSEAELERTRQIEANAANGNEQEGPNRRRAANDATPRTLYVHRKLKNADAVLQWAASAGIGGLLDPDKLHVTLAYSKMPVDWMKVGEDWNGSEDGGLRVAPGGVRLVEVLGDDNKAVVLMFSSSQLSWRHEQIKQAGAKWKHDGYQPHITVSWSGLGDIDPKTIEAYQGELLFGPEVFAEIDPDWEKKVKPQ